MRFGRSKPNPASQFTDPNAATDPAATTPDAKPKKVRRQINLPKLPFGMMAVIYALCGITIASMIGVCAAIATHMPTQTVDSAIYLMAGAIGLTVVALLIGAFTERTA